MQQIKTHVLEAIVVRAVCRMAAASTALARAAPDDKELALAELDFHRWVLDACRDCLKER